MDAHLENHLPLITARLVFAPRALPPPPTITPRMSFGFGAINLAGREESPMTEPKRARTPLRRADTARQITVPRRVEFRMPSEPLAQHNQAEYLSSASDEEMDNGVGGSDDDNQLDYDNDNTLNLIPKPKGDVSRPGRGGYTLYQALDWNQKTYDSVLVSKAIFLYEHSDVILPQKRWLLPNWQRNALTWLKAIAGRAGKKLLNSWKR